MKVADLDQPVRDGTASEDRRLGRDTTGYRVRGERVPSVTEVIGLAGLSSIEDVIAKAGAAVVERAAVRGKAVHAYCELVDLDPGFDLEAVPESLRGYVAAYARFVEEHRFRPVLSEEVVVSEALGFAGTLDRLGEYQGRPTLIDIKTPATACPAWPVQTAGYAIAVFEQYGQLVDRGSLQLQPNGRYRLHTHPDRADADLFLAALRVAQHRLAHGLATLEE